MVRTLVLVLSFAAGVALENGGWWYCPSSPYSIRSTPGDSTTARTQPTAAQAAGTSSWTDTLNLLRDFEEVNIIVPAIGQSASNVSDAAQLAVFQKIQDHMQFMAAQNQYVFGLFWRRFID